MYEDFSADCRFGFCAWYWSVVYSQLVATRRQAAKVKALEVTPEIQDAATRINAYFNSFQTLQR